MLAVSGRAGIMHVMRRADDITSFEDPSTSDAFHRELEGFLRHAEKPTSWRIVQLLKQSTYEVTELVSPLGEGYSGRDGWDAVSESKLFVRKCIDVSSGVGFAYEALWHAQKTGMRLAGVPYIESCERDGDELRVVMEYISGATVGSFVQAMGSGLDAVRLVMPALCEVVHGLHTRLAAPLIHRDLKPSNVIMREGEPVVIDFGCARTWNSGAEVDTTHFLTRCYAPPEQYGFGQTDVRSDVYALGKMLYFCATGENPPNVCSAETCAERGIPTALCTVIGRCCALDPDTRPATAREAERMVEGALQTLGATIARSSSHTGGAACRKAPVCGAVHNGPPADTGAVLPENSASLQANVLLGPRAVSRQAPETFEYTTPAAHKNGVFARLPLGVGKAWNALVFAGYSVGVVGSIMAIVEPNAHDALLPFWFRLLEYTIFGGLGIGAVCYLLLDRRRVYERIPALRELGIVRECVWCAVIFFASVLIPSLIGSAAGVL